MNQAGDKPGVTERTAEKTLLGRVLVVDDEFANRAYLRLLLAARGCEVVEAPDGEAALAMVRKDPPDLALVDVVMPGGNGYDVCRRMKEDPRTQDIPVIMVTAQTGIEDVEQGFVVGAFDYIRKPFQPRELIARVRNALDLKRSNEALHLWKRRMSRELEVAGSLQRKLFSTDPLFDATVEVHMAYQPSLHVGGDVFNALPLPDGGLCVCVGDVAGHGVAPAMISALLKAIINEAVREFAAAGPAAICRAIQSRFRHDVQNPELYATLFLGILSPDRRRWTCMNCGHPEPLLVGADGADFSAQLNGRGGTPIGFSFDSSDDYEEAMQTEASAVPGSKLMLVTDGLIESRHQDTGEPCGEARLAGIGRRVLADPCAINPAAAILETLRAEGFPLSEDDCSVVVVERIDPASIGMEMQIALDLPAVAGAAAQLDRVLQGAGWSGERAGAAQLALMEYGTNVIRHGRAPVGSTIAFRMRLTGPVCRMTFRDQGRAWEMAEHLVSSQSLPMDRENGRGLNIIHAVSHHVVCFRRENNNIAFMAILRQDTGEHGGRCKP
ncbi:MAG: ATP-binding SpoIIE family protein phosphatase [Kiritimatiellia bacterium]